MKDEEGRRPEHARLPMEQVDIRFAEDELKRLPEDEVTPNTGSVALIFEGGAMRNSYTAAVVTTLLQNNINFPIAYGISAGASHAVNYVARDWKKARATFVDSAKDPKAGGVLSFFSGNGFFNEQYVFEGTSELHAEDPSSPWYFNWEAFKQNKADVHIEAFEMETGKTVAFTKSSMKTTTDVMERVCASSAYPLFTPSTEIDGRHYIDGGMGTSHGICVDAARRDGYERFFIVLTEPRGYMRKPINHEKRAAYKIRYKKYPKVYEALLERPAAYNRLLDEIRKLERYGSAYVFYPKTMPITYKTTSYDRLVKSYDLGMKQCREELPEWLRWLDAG
ncbi:MAG: patatin family protein [Eggerthellaceae bacterium]|nr:patatin family protein [Eggerthellaceae bacterium]